MRMITKSVLIAPVLIAAIASSFAFAQSISSSTDANQTTDAVRHETENTSKEAKFLLLKRPFVIACHF